MLPEDFDYEKYKEEFLEKIKYNTYLADEADFETELDDVIDYLDTDEIDYKLDINTINDLVETLYAVLKQIGKEKLKERSDCKEIMKETDYTEVVSELLQKNLSKEDFQNKLHRRISILIDQTINTLELKKQQKELFKIEHPNLAKVNKKNIYILYVIIALVISVFMVIPFLSVFVSSGIEAIKSEMDITGKIFSAIVGLGFPMLAVAVFIWQMVIVFKRASKL